VPHAVWDYQVAGMRVVRHWFRYRTGEPTGRYPTELDTIQPDRWDHTTITELLDLLNVLSFLVDLAPTQRETLRQICQGPRIGTDELVTSGAIPAPIGTDSPLPADTPQSILFL